MGDIMSTTAMQKQLAEGVLNGPLELYSVLQPRGPGSEVIHLTDPKGSASYAELISDDNAFAALVAYLVESNVPLFDHFEKHDAYLDALRKNLKGGMTPVAARDAARKLFSSH